MGVRNQLSPHVLLAFFSNRALRGGPSILVYLAVSLFVSLLGATSLSRRLSEETIGIVQPSWYWSKGQIWAATKSAAKNGKTEEQGRDDEGGLRIVVFGGRDIATPDSAGQEGKNNKPGWTEILCQELRCSSYMSFVPSGPDGGRSSESNDVYAEVLEQASNWIASGTSSGGDYCFQAEQLPGASDLADLEAQVTEFLSMEKPSTAPEETLWVFTVGTWDIGSLAALPLDLSLAVVHKMTEDMFDQVERLYQSALDDKSIAWSALRNMYPSNNSGVEAQEKGMFRILIPMVLEPTMPPMWTTDRPLLTSTPSQVEQMRNAFILTGEWNTHLYYKIDEWIMGPNNELGPRQQQGWPYWNMGEDVPDGDYFVDAIQRLRAEADATAREKKEQKAEETREKERRAGGSEAPLRDGFLFDLPEYILDAMAEWQLRNAKLEDGNGSGGKPVGEGYLDVWTPCTNKGGNDWSSSLCDAENHLFSTPSTLASRAISDIGSLAAEMVRYNVSMRSI